MKRFFVILFTLLMLFASVACNKNKDDMTSDGSGMTEEEQQFAANDAIKLPNVVRGSMSFKDIGIITFELYPNVARQSVLNFIYLANSGHFNGIIVDRIVKDVVIQAGDYESGFLRRETAFDYGIVGEFSENGIENSLHISRGVMAWSHDNDDNDSAHTEFCIYTNEKSTWDIDGKYAAFGVVTGEESLKVLDKINGRKTRSERPVKEIEILNVTLEPVDQEGFDPFFLFPEPNFILKGSDSAHS